MNERMDVLTPVKSNDGRTFWRKVGVSFANQNGPGFNIKLELMPIPTGEPGGLSLVVRPPDPQRGQGQAPQRPQQQTSTDPFPPRRTQAQPAQAPASPDPDDTLPW